MEIKIMSKEELIQRFSKSKEEYQEQLDNARKKATELKGRPVIGAMIKIDEYTDVTGFILDETDDYLEMILIEKGLSAVRISKNDTERISITPIDD